MEIIRQRNQPTTFIFPLLTSGSNSYYTTSAWSNLSSKSISAYYWTDSAAPTALTLSQTPTQLAATGLWSLSATAAEMNNGDYMAIKLKSTEIQEQTILVILTSYAIKSLADTNNKVNANAVSTSAYTFAFPAVSVSAYTNFPQVSVSAQTGSHPAVSVSGSTVSLSASVRDWLGTAPNALQSGRVDSYVGVNNDKTGYSVTANSDKTNYSVSGYTFAFPQVYVSAGQVTNVTGNVSGSVASVTGNVAGNVTGSVGSVTGAVGSVTAGVTVTTNNDKTNYTISGQTNHPAYPAMSVSGSTVSLSASVRDWLGTTPNALQSGRVDSYVGVNNDKTGYSITANSDKTNYSVSGYTFDFPQVYVSAGQVTNVTGNVSGSVASVMGNVAGNVTGSVGSVTGAVGSVTAGVTVTTNNDKTNYTVSSGTITNVTGNISGSVNNLVVNPTVTVGQVQVSGINGGLYVGTSAYTNFPQVYVSAGQVTNVTGNVSGSVNNLVVNPTVTVGEVTVSAYNNFPQVYVSAIAPGIEVSATVTIDYVKIKDASVSAIDERFTFSGTDVKAFTTNTINVDLSPVQNTVNAISSVTNQFTFSGTNVNAYSTNELTVGQVAVSAINCALPQVQVSGINSGLYVGTSAYINFPQVSVSAQTGSHPEVSTSAYTNFPQVTVSAFNVAFPQVYVSAGNITNVTGNVSGSVASVTGNVAGNVTGSVGSVTGNVNGSVNFIVNQVSVSAQTNHPDYPAMAVSAYTNFPQVTVVSNLDKSNYGISGTKKSLDALNDINGSSVTATSVTDKINYSISGTKKLLDNLNDINGSSVTAVSIPAVTVGEVTVSAYNNFPQVSVSANLDKTGYTVTGGSIDKIISSVEVSAYTNFPQVYVSGISNEVVTTIQAGLATTIAVNAVNTAISALNNLSNTDIQTILGLNTSSTIDELTTLLTNPSIAQALMISYMQRRNKQVTDSTNSKVETYNNSGTKVFEGIISDTGTVFTKEKLS